MTHAWNTSSGDFLYVAGKTIDWFSSFCISKSCKTCILKCFQPQKVVGALYKARLLRCVVLIWSKVFCNYLKLFCSLVVKLAPVTANQPPKTVAMDNQPSSLIPLSILHKLTCFIDQKSMFVAVNVQNLFSVLFVSPLVCIYIILCVSALLHFVLFLSVFLAIKRWTDPDFTLINFRNHGRHRLIYHVDFNFWPICYIKWAVIVTNTGMPSGVRAF